MSIIRLTRYLPTRDFLHPLDREILRQNLSRATETFLENKIMIKEFADEGLDFSIMAKQEELKVFRRYTGI